MGSVWSMTYVGGLPASVSAEGLARIREVAQASMRTYDALFAEAGVGAERVRGLAEQVEWSIGRWAPDLAEEIEGSAAVLGLPVWQMYARNARTEIIALSPNTQGHAMAECSTVGRLPTGGRPTVAAQTWDWHLDLAEAWHLAKHPRAEVPFVTMTELGILAKSGINAAGVGVLLNMLHHASDGQAAPDQSVIPIHTVLRRVLDRARTVAEARAIVMSAPVAASSCLTLVGPDDIDCLEVTPQGVASVGRQDGWVAHTNHFVDPSLAPGDTRTRTNQTTPARLAAARARIAAHGQDRGSDRDVVTEILHCHETGAPVCRHSTPETAFADRWATLSTVVLEPERRRMSVSAGGPCGATPNGWAVVTVKA